MYAIKIDRTENTHLPNYKLDQYNVMFRKLKKQKLPKHPTFKEVLEQLK